MSRNHGLILKWVGHKYRIVAFRAGGEHCDRCADQFLDVAHIFHRLRRQIVPAPRTPRCPFPALQRLVHRLDPGLGALTRRQIVDLLAIEPVARADFDLVEPVEDIELGQRYAVDAVYGHRLAPQKRVEPAAAPLAPGYRSELVTALAEKLAGIVVLLGREWPLSHAGRVGFRDPKYITDGAGPDSRACRSLA